MATVIDLIERDLRSTVTARVVNKTRLWIWMMRVEHTAAFPDRLIRELLKPIAQPGDILLDPFSGSGTVGAVGAEFGCSYVGYDLNPAFNSLASKRLSGEYQVQRLKR